MSRPPQPPLTLWRRSAGYFPHAKAFDFTIIPITGHITVYHSSVQQTFTSARDFLVRSCF